MKGTLGIIGVGLIGGSVGLAAGDSGWEVVGVDTPGCSRTPPGVAPSTAPLR